MRPRPWAEPGIGRRPPGSSWSVMAARFSHARRAVRLGVGSVREGILSGTTSRSPEARGRRNRHHHRRRRGQGPRPRHPQPLRRACRRGGRDHRGHLTASSLGLEAGQRYRDVFGELGVTRVRPLHAVTRPQANDESAAARGPRCDRHLPDRRQPAPPVLDHRRHAPRGRHPRAIPPRRGRRRDLRRRLGDVEPHDRVRGVRGDPEAPDGPDRGRPRGPARRHHRPALPAAEPARPAAQPDRPEPVPARPRRRRGHRRRGRPRPRHGGHRARLDHRRRRLAVRDRRLGGPRPPAADDQRRRAALPAGGLPLRPPPSRADRRPPTLHALPGGEAASS